jgi:REP element-mobilizing transposase RayT
MVSYPEHLENFDYIGVYRYFLTFCTPERRRHFTEADHVSLVRDQFLRRSTEDHFSIPAYCFMPDHVHLLVEGTQDDSDLRRFVKGAKQYSGFYCTQRTNERCGNDTASSASCDAKKQPSTWRDTSSTTRFDRVWSIGSRIMPTGDRSRTRGKSCSSTYERPPEGGLYVWAA